MNIKIYQVNMDRDIAQDNVAFMGYDVLESFQGTQQINSGIYDKVYECSMEGSSLEDVYCKFNIDHPADYRGRSLSVSDIVEVSDAAGIENGFYFCDTLGFRRVNFEPEKAKEFIPPKPRLSDVMREAQNKAAMSEQTSQTPAKEVFPDR